VIVVMLWSFHIVMIISRLLLSRNVVGFVSSDAAADMESQTSFLSSDIYTHVTVRYICTLI